MTSQPSRSTTTWTDEDVVWTNVSRGLDPAASMSEADLGVPQPWFDEAHVQTKELLLLNQGWDSYGAPPISERAVTIALRVLRGLMATGIALERPYIGPTSLGGIKLEWDTDEMILGIEIDPPDEPSVFFSNGVTGEEWEEPVSRLPRPFDEVLLLLTNGADTR